MEEVGGVGWGMRKYMAEDPSFVGWTRAEEGGEGGNGRGNRIVLDFASDVWKATEFVFDFFEGDRDGIEGRWRRENIRKGK